MQEKLNIEKEYTGFMRHSNGGYVRCPKETLAIYMQAIWGYLKGSLDLGRII